MNSWLEEAIPTWSHFRTDTSDVIHYLKTSFLPHCLDFADDFKYKAFLNELVGQVGIQNYRHIIVGLGYKPSFCVISIRRSSLVRLTSTPFTSKVRAS